MATGAQLTFPDRQVISVSGDSGLSMPPKITGEQVFGFATAMSKVVLNKGAGEAVSMARSNLRNLPRGGA